MFCYDTKTSFELPSFLFSILAEIFLGMHEIIIFLLK